VVWYLVTAQLRPNVHDRVVVDVDVVEVDVVDVDVVVLVDVVDVEVDVVDVDVDVVEVDVVVDVDVVVTLPPRRGKVTVGSSKFLLSWLLTSKVNTVGELSSMSALITITGL